MIQGKDSYRPKDWSWSWILRMSYGIFFVYLLNHICQEIYKSRFGSQNPTLEEVQWKYLIPMDAAFLTLLNAFFWTLYYFEIPIFDQFKVNSAPWPWKENPTKWKKLLKDTVLYYGPIQIVFGTIVLKVYYMIFVPCLDVSRSVGVWEITWQFCFCLFWEDFFLYFGHRLLHTPFFYRTIHKIHHRYNITINIAVFFMHPLELLISAMLPHFAGHMILKKKMHISTFLAWGLYRSGHTNEQHSGYQFPWSPFYIFPTSIDPSYHDYHHYKNNGNYAIALHIWDTYFKTNQYYRKQMESIKE